MTEATMADLDRKIRPKHYELAEYEDWYALADALRIPPAALEAITKISRAWVREPRLSEENPVLCDLYAARVALDRQIQLEQKRMKKRE
jgi:hypothetical protein